MEIILASKSPRRRELLTRLTSDFTVITARCDEDLGELAPDLGVAVLAERKGRATFDFIERESGGAFDKMIISSDTLVELDGVALGKPTDEAHAEKMLEALSGREHRVHTGVCVRYKGRVFSGTATTRVKFRELSRDEILDYIATGEPMDKAGAYGIQGQGGRFVEHIDGDFDTVVGLSLRLTEALMKEAKEGIELSGGDGA